MLLFCLNIVVLAVLFYTISCSGWLDYRLENNCLCLSYGTNPCVTNPLQYRDETGKPTPPGGRIAPEAGAYPNKYIQLEEVETEPHEKNQGALTKKGRKVYAILRCRRCSNRARYIYEFEVQEEEWNE